MPFFYYAPDCFAARGFFMAELLSATSIHLKFANLPARCSYHPLPLLFSYVKNQ